jgi:Flp pilus assembly pilin Flp
MKRLGKITTALRRLACDGRGASSVEYVLLLALVGLPSLVVFLALLKVMAGYYNMVVFVETLPMP